jgi:phage terminase large subunit
MEDKAYRIKNTTATKKVFDLKKKIRAVAGGTSASKTISILIWCIDYAQSTENQLISVVSESFPHLEKGAILDFKAIMKDRGYWDENRWHDTKHAYEFERGTVLEFFSSDADKAHGPRRDVLFLNEAQHLPFEQADQLIVRTRRIVWMDWNPTNEFWFYTDMLGKREDIDFITLTYKDNEALEPDMVAEIESRRHRKGWWQVYGLGQLGEVEGKIYRDWQIIDEIPHEARLERKWVDFGYSNDPTSTGDLYYFNGGYILDEGVYQKGLSNKQIADYLQSANAGALVVADSAEPKSIDELHSYGVNITPADKGKDSVVHGIQLVQDQRISVTKRSTNIIREYRNYLWMTDKNGKILNEPEHAYSHSMDGIRYALSNLLKQGIPTEQEYLALQTTRRERVDSRIDAGM